MTQEPFQPGDVVELLSGGPHLTVVASDLEKTVCYYANNDYDIKRIEIPTIALELAEDYDDEGEE